MAKKGKERYKILIADDSEFNRELLIDMLEDEYEILEAENGLEALAVLKDNVSDIALVLLDIVMPQMDGFDVLAAMNRYHWIEDLPVIMISSETAPAYIHRAYDLGASDYINRPFDPMIVQRRVNNSILAYAKKQRLTNLVVTQIYEREKTSNLMVSILSHIVEFRNGESGMHVLHVQLITEMLLNELRKKSDRYKITNDDIKLMSMASALHDIGKISIPDAVLNKPGRFTPEEFAIMKTHSAAGAGMIADLPFYKDEPLAKVAHDVCRWHHERWDGRGYPDGLKGDDIPIAAQVVAMADVYDALTSKRCYKDAYSHDVAMNMIINGECGTFNPDLLDCLKTVSDQLADELKTMSYSTSGKRMDRSIADELSKSRDLSGTERTLAQLKLEREKFQFLCASTMDIVFFMTYDPDILMFNENGSRRLGIPETILNPAKELNKVFGSDSTKLNALSSAIKTMAPGDKNLVSEAELMMDGILTKCLCIIHPIWNGDAEPQRIACVGRVVVWDENVRNSIQR